MESPNIKLLDKLVKLNVDAYLRLNDDDVPIFTELYNFQIIRTSYNYYINGKMKFEMILDKPLLLTLNGTTVTLKLIYEQLLSLLPPKFKDVDEQIDYILLVDQLTSGDSDEIKMLIKDIRFDDNVYLELIKYGINHINYKIKIEDNRLVKLFLIKYGLYYEGNANNKREKFIITDDIRIKIFNDLKCYNILFIDKYERCLNKIFVFEDITSTNISYINNIVKIIDYFLYNHEHKILIGNMLYDVAFFKEYMFAHNPKKYESMHHKHDRISEELTINNITFKHLMIFKPFKCDHKLCFNELSHWHCSDY
jgi:hypothetical protein